MIIRNTAPLSRVKGHIVESVADEDGHLRVLVSTIAFGMGVNCKKVRRIIHFRPSKSEEMYVQECGRAGRDGLPSTCVLLYNGFLSTHCEKAMKEYLSSSECHRKCLMSRFGFSNELQVLVMHSFVVTFALQLVCVGPRYALICGALTESVRQRRW